MPAHVPKIGAPAWARSRIGWRRPQRSMSLRIVVLSPPGRMRPATSSRSAGRRTSTGVAPTWRSIATCSANAPWTARTPMRIPSIRMAREARLPAADRQPLRLRDGFQGDAAHRLPEALGDLGDDLGIVEVRRRLDDGVGGAGRILAT